MTEYEFSLGLHGSHVRAKNGERLRYIVCDALTKKASELRKAKRADRCSLLTQIVSSAEKGTPPTKKMINKAAPEINELRSILVDGVSIAEE